MPKPLHVSRTMTYAEAAGMNSPDNPPLPDGNGIVYELLMTPGRRPGSVQSSKFRAIQLTEIPEGVRRLRD